MLAVSNLALLAQGRVYFNNFNSPLGVQPVTIGAFNQGASGGFAGDYLGSNYSIQLLWAPGTFANEAAFYATNPSASAAFAFFGTTGSGPTHGPTVDGAGLFDAGTLAVGFAPGTYTMQARAWFNNGQFATYFIAFASGRNTGVSQLIQVDVTASPTPAPNTAFPSFVIPQIPEPAIFALISLGAACAMLFRDRKR